MYLYLAGLIVVLNFGDFVNFWRRLDLSVEIIEQIRLLVGGWGWTLESNESTR